MLCLTLLSFALQTVFSQYRCFRPTQSLSPASVLWCAVRSALIYTHTEGEKRRRCEGTSDLVVSQTVQCEKVLLFCRFSSCTFSSARRSFQRPGESGKTARWPSKETSWGISSHRLLLKTPGNSKYSCILFLSFNDCKT